MLGGVDWKLLAEVDPSASLSDAFLTEFAIDNPCVFPTFRAVVTRHVLGDVRLFLRFGFDILDAAAATQFIDFPGASLAALNASEMRSFAWALGAAPPDAAGNALSILPPYCRVNATTPVGTNLTVAIYGSWIRV